LSVLEQVFGFDNEAFSSYMSRARNTQELAQLVPRLGESDHPIVLGAAGCAAMEWALHPVKPYKKIRQESFNRRKNYLEEAGKYWQASLDGLPALIQSRPLIEDRKELAFMRVQTMHRLAYLPMMESVASLYSYCSLSPQEMADREYQTRHNLVGLAKTVMSMPREKGRVARYRAGLLGEIACGMVGMMDNPAKYILLPSSIRNDHDCIKRQRADLIAITTEPPYNKSLIQVGSNKGSEVIDRKRVFFDPAVDLVLSPGKYVASTVGVFSDITQEIIQPDCEDYGRLAVLGRVMTMRIDQFNDARQQASQQSIADQ